jgi:FecR protein
MRITSRIGSSALAALMLVGLSSRAQEAVSPATAASDDANPTINSQAPATDSGYSKVRIVRLSEVKGEVQLDRNVGRGFETPMTNLPITEGVKLKTGDGVAEIEFEDNSTVRVAQNSLIEFPRLEMLPSGAKMSSVNVLQGMVYVSLMNTKGNEFTLTFGKEKLNLPPDSHVRLQMTSGQADLAVLHGDVLVQEPAGITPVGKNKTMVFNLAGEGQPVVAKNVIEQPLDSWDHDAAQYHKSYANATSFGNSPYSYGINDMNYYGSFINASGCGGSMWRPYFTSTSWDPYGSGAWAYYPSAGYSWVSPYPWAWTPYHYGSWSFCQGVGWGWRPGGAWMGLANNSFVSAPAGSGPTTTRPRPPTHAPITAHATLVPVNMKAIPTSGLAASRESFVFKTNSAGLGVPRGSLGKLNNFSGQTASHGLASTNVYYGGQRATEGGARAGNSSNVSGQQISTTNSTMSSSRSSSSSAMQGPAGGGMSHASSGAGGGAGRH